jgi:glycosyltransferase involved in cell wall biosynthesis
VDGPRTVHDPEDEAETVTSSSGPADESPLVSVVLPTYDRETYLREAVDSVFSQSYDSIELILVDDHSPVPTKEVLSDRLEQTAHPVECLRHEENQGASAARNTGIEAASGDFIAFLDDDDYWKPTKVEQQLNTFAQASPEVGVVCTGQAFVDDGRTVSVQRPTVRKKVTRDLLSGAEVGTFSTVMVRSTVPDVVGDLDERFPCWQDREWLLRASTDFEFEIVPEPLAVRRSSEHDQLSDDFEAKREVALPLFIEKFRPLAASYGRGCERAMLGARLRELGRSGVRHGYFHDGRRYLLRSLRYDPLDASTYLYLISSLGGETTLNAARRLRQAIHPYMS